MKTVRFVAKGKVQGVGYREFVRKNAEALGLKGWVRNDPEGTVTGIVEGEPENVDKLIERLKPGPRAAVVHGVDVSRAEALEAEEFVVKR